MLAFGSAALFGQPDRPGQPPGETQPGKGQRPERDQAIPSDPAMLRQFIQRRLEATRRQAERLETALKDLESGSDPAEVRRFLLREARPGGGQGNPGEGPMRDAPEDGPGNQGQPGGDRPGNPQAGGPGAGGRQGPATILGEPMVRLNEHERAMAMEIIRGERPDLAERIESSARMPDVRERIYDILGFSLRGLADDKRRDPAVVPLRLDEISSLLEIMRVSGDYARQKRAGGSDDALQPLRDRLRAAAAEQFDTRLKIQQRQVERLGHEAEKMKANLARLAAERDRIVDEKTQQMLRLAERIPDRGRPGKGLGGSPGSPPPQPPK